MNVTGIILMICIYPMIFIMYFLLKLDAEPKKGIHYGVYLSAEYAKDTQLQEIENSYGRQMKCCFWAMTLGPLPFFFLPWESIVTAVAILWVFVSVFIFFVPYGVANKKLKKLKKEKGWKSDQDQEDNWWIWGLLYSNPEDKRSMVDKRVGVGSTINLATKGGKAFVIFILLSFVWMVLVAAWVVLLEFTPIHLRVSDNQVIGSQLREEIMISEGAIEEVEIMSRLPKMSRNSGTTMEKLKKGSWSVKGEEKNCQVFLNPQNSLFIRIKTPSKVFYLSGFDDEETKQVYEAICQ